MAVCDASILIALFRPADTHHERSSRWYQEALAEGEPLQAPTLLLVEVAGALMRITSDDAVVQRALAQIETDFDLHPLTAERARRAAQVASVCSVRGADAVYLALARELDDKLVTLDEQQSTRGNQVVSTQIP